MTKFLNCITWNHLHEASAFARLNLCVRDVAKQLEDGAERIHLQLRREKEKQTLFEHTKLWF